MKYDTWNLWWWCKYCGQRTEGRKEWVRGSDLVETCENEWTYTTFNILLTTPEAMFKEDIEDTTQTERRFYDVRGEFANCMHGRAVRSSQYAEQNSIQALKLRVNTFHSYIRGGRCNRMRTVKNESVIWD